MGTVWEDVLRKQIHERRRRLESVIGSRSDPRLAALLQEIDVTLERIDAGTFGRCDHCGGKVEADRLLADPLTTTCLDCLDDRQKRALEHDLELAGRIQAALLPRSTRYAGWEVCFRYQPAGAVSGDHCDIMADANGGGLMFVVGDVSGKGVAASLLMSQLHAIFRSLSPFADGVGELVARANRIFCESTLASHYATLVCGRASVSGEISLANAGHCPPLLVSADAVAEVPATGLPLGLFSDSEYTDCILRLAPGETLVIYTDGISEAQNASDAEYGAKRLAELLRARRELAPEPLLSACLEDLAAFRGPAPRRDDLTLMLIRRT